MPQIDSTKNLLHGTQPLVVGAVSLGGTLASLSGLEALEQECDFVELRLDSLALPSADVHALAAKLPVPRLITARDPAEGGHGNLSLAARQTLLEDHLDLATLMDVELRNAMELQGVINKATTRKVSVIGSFHDFTATPNDDVLKGAVDFGLQLKLDAVKIATTLQGPEDLARLIKIVSAEKRIPLSVMGMGPLGRVSRVTLARCGSILNYGYLGESNAPGQWPARRLKELLKEV